MIITFVGDVHGKVKEYLEIVKQNEFTFQVGDMGLGFAGVNLHELSQNHLFTRGNHDDAQK